MNPAITQVLFIAVLVAAFWFLIIRPQQQQRKQHDEMVSALQPGARIMTAGGMFGTIKAVEDGNVLVEIADGVVVEMVSGAIARIVPDEEDKPEPAESHEGHDDPEMAEDADESDIEGSDK